MRVKIDSKVMEEAALYGAMAGAFLVAFGLAPLAVATSGNPWWGVVLAALALPVLVIVLFTLGLIIRWGVLRWWAHRR